MKKKIELLSIAKLFNLLPSYFAGLLIVFLSFVSSIFYRNQAITLFQKEHAFCFSQNDKLLTKKDKQNKDLNFHIRAKAHLRDFIELFFAYDKDDCELRVERALWLGDSSIEKMQERLTSWFVNLSQNSLVTKILWEDIESNIEINPIKNDSWPFELHCVLETSRPGGEKTKEQLLAKGTLMEVARDFPFNPHGLLTCDFSFVNAPYKTKK